MRTGIGNEEQAERHTKAAQSYRYQGLLVEEGVKVALLASVVQPASDTQASQKRETLQNVAVSCTKTQSYSFN